MAGAFAAALVDVGALVEVIVVSLVAGVGATAAYAIALAGAIRFVELRRSGRPVEAVSFGVVAAIAIAVCIAAVVAGIAAMTSK